MSGVFARYAVVGLVQNGAFYALTLALVALGFAPWQAVLILYPIAVMVTFVANRSWSFKTEARQGADFRKYALVYVVAYPTVTLLMWVQGQFGVPPWIATFVTLVIAVIGMFIAMRYWVFPAKLRHPQDHLGTAPSGLPGDDKAACAQAKTIAG